MKKHTKIYFQHFNYDKYSFIPCEVCSLAACDIHHVDARGMGGDPQGKKDTIENLMALCRRCHDLYGDKKQYKAFLRGIHNLTIKHFENNK